MGVRRRGFRERTPVGAALEVLLGTAKPLGAEEVGLEKACGRVLAEDLVSSMDLPPFPRAAMDGYAVRGEDTFGASQGSPALFKVTGEAAMGRPFDGVVGEFEAVKVMTGGPLPRGADAVVIFEQAREEDGTLEVYAPVAPGKNASPRGEDVRKGERVLQRGSRLRPQDVAIAAALGVPKLPVSRRPRVGIISTGDELVEPGGRLAEGKIYEVNSYALASMVEMSGGLPERLGIVRDDYDEVKRAIEGALGYDLVLVSGATSVGEKDWVPEIVGSLGKVMVHGVAMRPGEPTGFGLVRGKMVFMLPGYPVASVVAFETFCRPYLQRLQGMEPCSPYPQTTATLRRKIASELGRRDFVRIRLERSGEGLFAEPIRVTGSGIVSSLVRADGFVIVPENTEGIEEGERVTVHLFKRC